MNAMTAGPPVLRSPGRCFLYLLASFGFWGFAWVWHTAKEVTPQIKNDDPAVIRTVLTAVPIANYVALYWSWDDIDNYGKRTGVGGFSTVLWLVLTIILGFPALIAYPLAQSRMNAAHLAASNGTAQKAPLYLADKITLAIGALIWVVFILVILLAVVLAN